MRKILPFINLNGKIVDRKSALTSVLSEGFLYGKGIFTTIKVRERVPLFFENHLNRLQTSLKQLNILSPITYHLSPIENAVYATIHKNKLSDGGLRITITPGIICMHVFTLKQFNNEAIKLITLPDPRDIYKTHKLTCRIPHLLAQKQAISQGAKDALFTQNNELIESTSANVIAYTDKNTIITPPILAKGLNGITRQILMENLPIREAPVPADTTNPLILINSLGLEIVESIDGRKINQSPKFITLIQETLESAEKSYINNNF